MSFNLDFGVRSHKMFCYKSGNGYNAWLLSQNCYTEMCYFSDSHSVLYWELYNPSQISLLFHVALLVV